MTGGTMKSIGLALALALSMSVAARADSADQGTCDSAYETSNYSQVMIYCKSAAQDYLQEAASTSGELHWSALALAGIDLHIAAWAAYKFGIERETAHWQLLSARRLFNQVLLHSHDSKLIRQVKTFRDSNNEYLENPPSEAQ